MSDLSAFLNPVVAEPREVVISKRFPAFIIRPLTQAENKALIRKATTRKKSRDGSEYEIFDRPRYMSYVIAAATIHPDFSSEERCKRYGSLDAVDVVDTMLYIGEHAALGDAIAELSGINTDGVDIEAEEEIKN